MAQMSTSLRVGSVVSQAGVDYIVNRLTEKGGHLTIDAISVEEASRRARNLIGLLELSGNPLEDDIS